MFNADRYKSQDDYKLLYQHYSAYVCNISAQLWKINFEAVRQECLWVGEFYIRAEQILEANKAERYNIK